MDEITCPNCNCDASREELKKSGLLCPTCGFDLSDLDDPDDAKDDSDDDEDDEEDAD